MKTFTSVDDILNFAIRSARETADYLTLLSTQARSNRVRKIFERFAREEFVSMVRLSRIRELGPMDIPEDQIGNFRIDKYVTEPREASELKYTDALELAMRKVHASFRLYLDLESKTTNAEIKSLLKGLARNEAAHSGVFETEYNNTILVC